MLQVGQTLWWVPIERRNWIRQGGATVEGEVTVQKVGRKWVKLSNARRIDKTTFWADGGGNTSPGRCYVTRDAFDLAERSYKAWRSLRNEIDKKWEPPAEIDAAIIRQAAELLGLQLPDAE